MHIVPWCIHRDPRWFPDPCHSGPSASRPRPSAFLVIGIDLLGKLDVRFGTFTMNVVEYDRLAVAWSFGKPDVPRNNGLEHLASEKAP